MFPVTLCLANTSPRDVKKTENRHWLIGTSFLHHVHWPIIYKGCKCQRKVLRKLKNQRITSVGRREYKWFLKPMETFDLRFVSRLVGKSGIQIKPQIGYPWLDSWSCWDSLLASHGSHVSREEHPRVQGHGLLLLPGCLLPKCDTKFKLNRIWNHHGDKSLVMCLRVFLD